MDKSWLKHSLVRVTRGVGLLLLIPLAGQLFLSDMNWGMGDFVAAALLLFCAGMAYLLLARLTKTPAQKLLAFAVVLILLAAVWVESAVGIFR